MAEVSIERPNGQVRRGVTFAAIRWSVRIPLRFPSGEIAEDGITCSETPGIAARSASVTGSMSLISDVMEPG